MIDRELVVWAYRVLLGRDPESEPVIQFARSVDSRETLVRGIMASDEFANQNTLKLRSKETINADVWVDVFDEFFLKVNLSDQRGVSGPVITKTFELAETQFVKNSVKPGNFCLDIGANIGYYTLLLAHLVGYTGSVTSFEPHPEIFGYLRSTITKNNLTDRVNLENVALGEEKGVVHLQFATQTDNWGGSALNFAGVEIPDHSNLEVPVLPLTHFSSSIPKCDFIKIDVEGAEYKVVLGGMDLISKFKPMILSELHTNQLQKVSGVTGEDYISLLTERGYACHELENNGRLSAKNIASPNKQLSNVVFVPR